MLSIFSSILILMSGLLISEVPIQQERVLYTNGNIYTVYNGPTQPTKFVLRQPSIVTTISNYHWNNGRGVRPGTISLRNTSGKIFGPWPATGMPGMGGVPNANWLVTANVRLEPGEYTVLDSSVSTWSHNAQSSNAGMTTIKGYLAGVSPSPTPTPTSPSGPGAKVTALTENRGKQKVLIWLDGKPPKTMMDVLNYHLEPGWKGSLSVTIPANGKLKFVAGDGSAGPAGMYDKIIASCIWSGDPKDPKRFPHIIYEGGSALNCSTLTKP